MIPPLARRCWPSPHLCLAATWLASSHHPEMGRLSVVIYNIHTERLISHIQYSHREVNFTQNYQLMFQPCLLDPSCFLFLFLCMQHPIVCLILCTENKENVVDLKQWYAWVGLPDCCCLPHGSGWTCYHAPFFELVITLVHVTQ